MFIGTGLEGGVAVYSWKVYSAHSKDSIGGAVFLMFDHVTSAGVYT